MRVPDHPVALALLTAFGGGVTAPSANRFGSVSPTAADDVRAELGDAVDFVLDCGHAFTSASLKETRCRRAGLGGRRLRELHLADTEVANEAHGALKELLPAVVRVLHRVVVGDLRLPTRPAQPMRLVEGTPTGEPSTPSRSSRVTPPGRRMVGVSLVVSTMVDSTLTSQASSTRRCAFHHLAQLVPQPGRRRVRLGGEPLLDDQGCLSIFRQPTGPQEALMQAVRRRHGSC
jgi:hypothetical protein